MNMFAPPMANMPRQCYGVRHWPIWLLLIGFRGLSLLPLPLLAMLGAAFGETAYWLHPSRRRITRRNLQACFPEHAAAEIRALARRHFRALGAVAFAGMVAWWGGRRRLDRLTHLHGREILEDAHARGANIILLAPHFVGLEYTGIYLSTVLPLATMYQPNKNPLLDALIKGHRARFGGILYSRQDTTRSMIREIRTGRAFYYLPDQDPRRNKKVFAPFYTVPTATFTTLARITRMTDATVIPCMTRLLPYGRGFEIHLNSPLTDYPCGDELHDATRMNQAVERLIAIAPEQYFWSHRRFKTRPPGAPKFYA